MKACRHFALVVGMVFGLFASPTALAQETVKIGFIYPDTGAFAQLGIDMRDGFLMYWDEVGRKAGGRSIELITETKATNKPDEALTKARKLVELDNVALLSGIVSTPVAYAVAQYAKDRKVPLVIMNAGADDLTQRSSSKYVFRSSSSNSDGSHPLGEWAYEKGYRKAVIMAADFGGGYEIIGGFAAAFKKAGGRVIQEIYPPLGTQDYAPYLTNIAKDADVVSVFFGGADAVRFVQQYSEYGLKKRIPLIGRGGITDSIILPKQGAAALGIVSGIHWDSGVETPQNKRFVQAYESRYKRAVTRYAEQGYVGARMMAEAINAAKGRVNDESFLAAMQRVSFDAPRGPFRLDELHNPVQNIYLLQVVQAGDKLTHKVIKTYPATSQFWKWLPKEYMSEAPYQNMKGKWTNK